MKELYWTILVPMFYAALLVFVFGTIFRLYQIFKLPKHPSTLAIHPKKKNSLLYALYDTFFMPTVRKHAPFLWFFLMAFHIALLLLILGHLELIRSFSWIQVIPHQIFLGKGFVGLTIVVSLIFFLLRRFHTPYRELSVPEDYYLLILLLLVSLLGSEMDWARTWYGYSELSVEDYRTYLYSIFIFKPHVPSSIYDSGHSFMLVLHVFFGNIFLMVFPFTKIMHSFLALPVNKLRRG
jgi:nitrate reductase gamma subunit